MIFICTFDPFGRGKYRYTFKEQCQEDGALLEDGTCKIFLSTRGSNDNEVSGELIQFLAYVEQPGESLRADREFASQPEEDELLIRLKDKIHKIKRDRRMEGQYMLFEELLSDERREGREEGRIEGREEGREEILLLINAMIADGHSEDLSRLTNDQEFLEEMYQKYGRR